MENKIAELTGKLFHEGVEKGEKQAAILIREAEEKAARIRAGAEAEAKAVAEKAAREAEECRRNMESELKLAAIQAVDAVKQKIMQVVSLKAVEEPVGRSFSDPAVVTEFIRLVLQNWKAGPGATPDLVCLLPEGKRKELEQAADQAARSALAGNVEIRFSPSLKAGFRIGPRDGSFLVSFTDDDFKEFFSLYLRPRTRAFIFGA